jgi:Tfp pilus assembly protein PilN
MNHVNFIPAERRARRHNRSRLWAWGVLCGTCLGAMILAALLTQVVAAPGLEGIEAEIARSKKLVEDTRTTVIRLQSELRRQSAVVEANRAIGRQPDWGQLLVLIADAVGDDIILQSCRLDVDPGAARDDDAASEPRRCRLRIGGLGTSQDSVTGFVLRLEETQLFDEVQLGGTEQKQFEDETRVGFELSCFATMEGGAG